MTQREQFEAWAVNEWAKNNSMHAAIVLERGKDGEYCSLMTRGAWMGWQGASAITPDMIIVEASEAERVRSSKNLQAMINAGGGV